MNTHAEEDVFSRKLDLKLWGRLLRHALPYKLLTGLLLFSGVLIAACDASFALVTRWAIDSVIAANGGVKLLWQPALVYGGLASLLALGVFLFIFAAGGLSNRMAHDIRAACFERLQELELAYFDHRPTGWLISRLTSDCDKLARILAWGTLDLFWAVLLVTAIGVILIVLNAGLGFLMISVLLPLLFISAYFQKKLLLSARESRRMNSLITARFNECLQGMRTTKTLNREDSDQKEFQKLSGGMYAASMQHALQGALFLPIVLTVGSVAAGLALWKGGGMVLEDTITPGTLVAFIFYAGAFFHPVNQIADVLVRMQGAQAAGERVLDLLATQPAIVDSESVRQRMESFKAVEREPGLAPDGLPATIQQLQFDHVSFAYLPGEEVVSDFNLEIRTGEMVALVGESGGGKTTLVNLAARFYEPTGGCIRINGVPLTERSLDWYHQQVGMVLQEPHLFSGTILENIRYGKLDASRSEIEEVARMVHAHNFIEHLPLGYETPVGEGGSLLSTGQKQLIALARALIASPQILIMDEATSSIDTESERLIQEGLQAVFSGRISLVIAHRLSTIRSADKILVIEQGRVRESGTHASLMRAGGLYQSLYTRQFEKTILAESETG